MKFFKKIPTFEKRQKIIISSLIVTIGLVSTQLVDFNLRFHFMFALAGLSYLVSFWSLWVGIYDESAFLKVNKTKALTLLTLPALFALAVASFYFLLPIRWLTRIPFAAAFGFAFYLLLLVQNLFNVASIRTIPLYRAASTVAFLYTLITAFLLFNVLYAFNMLFIWNGLLVFILSFPLILQILWSIEMDDRISVLLLVQSFVLSLVVGEFAVALSFWPLYPMIWALSLASTMYVVVGLTTEYLRGRLSGRVVKEYIGIAIGIFIVAYLFTGWN